MKKEKVWNEKEKVGKKKREGGMKKEKVENGERWDM